jgi:D-xylose transport system ATP-binding protein
VSRPDPCDPPTEVDRVPGPLLEVRGVAKRFGGVQALRDVDFDCAAGEVTALVGDNGAGKSTLVKIISGTLAPDHGTVRLGGQAVLPEPAAAAALGITAVYQDLALCDDLDVVANLFLGRETVVSDWRGLRGTLDETAMERQAAAVLNRLGSGVDRLRWPVAALSGGQRQQVALARAFLAAPRLVVLDEPTAALGAGAVRHVLDLVRRLRDDGLGVVMVSHSMPDVFAVSDRIAILRLGRMAATFSTPTVTPNDVVATMTGSRVGALDGSHQ